MLLRKSLPHSSLLAKICLLHQVSKTFLLLIIAVKYPQWFFVVCCYGSLLLCGFLTSTMLLTQSVGSHVFFFFISNSIFGANVKPVIHDHVSSFFK